MSTTPEQETKSIDFGYRTHRVRFSRFLALRVSTRGVVVSVVLLVIAILAALLAMGFGDYTLSAAEVVQSLLGQGDEFQRMIVVEWRLPVALAAIMFGILLGIGGAIFQSLTRNPLGSPDVIGFDAGAYTAVVVTVLVVGTNQYWSIAAAALLGGLATAVVVYLLAYRRGLQSFRLIIVGIAVSALLGSVNVYLVTRADINDAMSVGFWSAGSLSKVTWSALVPVSIGAVIILIAVVLLSPTLRQLELGDDAALAQGAKGHLARPLLMVIGVAATALVTAASGPIGFVALAAPQLARRLTRSPGVTISAAACMGAALLACAHALSVIIGHAYQSIPVGLITVCLGGIYLIWLLIRETRKRI